MKASSLTMKLASASPKGTSSGPLVFPSMRVHSPIVTPTKGAGPNTSALSSSTPLLTSPSKRSTVLFPQTPRHKRINASTMPLTPQTPSTSISADTGDAERPPETPSKQTGANAKTAPATPSTSRRQALYERVRQRSLTASPTKNLSVDASNLKLSRDQLLKLSQDEMRRRCLLGRLGGIAESIWMFVLFTSLSHILLMFSIGFSRRLRPVARFRDANVEHCFPPK
jgi:hypothetical protein